MLNENATGREMFGMNRRICNKCGLWLYHDLDECPSCGINDWHVATDAEERIWGNNAEKRDCTFLCLDYSNLPTKEQWIEICAGCDSDRSYCHGVPDPIVCEDCWHPKLDENGKYIENLKKEIET